MEIIKLICIEKQYVTVKGRWLPKVCSLDHGNKARVLEFLGTVTYLSEVNVQWSSVSFPKVLTFFVHLYSFFPRYLGDISVRRLKKAKTGTFSHQLHRVAVIVHSLSFLPSVSPNQHGDSLKTTYYALAFGANLMRFLCSYIQLFASSRSVRPLGIGEIPCDLSKWLLSFKW